MVDVSYLAPLGAPGIEERKDFGSPARTEDSLSDEDPVQGDVERGRIGASLGLTID